MDYNMMTKESKTQLKYHLRGEEYLLKGEFDKAIDCLKIALYHDPTNLNAKTNLNNLNDRIKNTQIIPPILLVTLPKSGTVFIAKAMREGLNLGKQSDSIANLISNGEIQLDTGRFPEILINYSILKKFAMQKEGVIGITHLPPTQFNVLMVNRYLDKVIINLRDPRQAILSLTHHFNELEVSEPFLNFTYSFPNHYFSLPLSKQIDYQIENWLPVFINWVEGWLDVSEDPRLQLDILFTHFEDMKNDPQIFFRSILEFYGISNGLLNPKQGSYIFAKAA